MSTTITTSSLSASASATPPRETAAPDPASSGSRCSTLGGADTARDPPVPTTASTNVRIEVDDRVLAAARAASRWVTLEDVQLALRLTGRDSKLDYKAARQLLAMPSGREGLREAAVALRHPAADWTLHWSHSQSAFYYAHKGRATRYVKVSGCPFGWAIDNVTRQYCNILQPHRQHDSLPTHDSSAAEIEPRRTPSWAPKSVGSKRKRDSSLADAVACEVEGVSFARYIRDMDAQKRQKIEGKREYFFSEVSPSLRCQIQMDEEASYSVTEMTLAEETSQLILDTLGWSSPSTCTITDATACVGGNTVNFARHFSKVVAVECNPTRARFLQHNVNLLCHSGSTTATSTTHQPPSCNVEVHCADYTAATLTLNKTDVVFFDPPWGGESYADRCKPVDLFLSGKPLVEICNSLATCQRTRFIVLKVPFNFGFTAFMKRGVENGGLRLLRKEGIGRGRGGRPKFVIAILECICG